MYRLVIFSFAILEALSVISLWYSPEKDHSLLPGVFLDYNEDGLYDDGTGFNIGEPSTRSDENGDFTLTSTQESFSIIAITDYNGEELLNQLNSDKLKSTGKESPGSFNCN